MWSDESFQVLLIIFGLLTGLGIVLICFAKGRRRRDAQFASFSVTISIVGREEAYVSYRSNGKTTEFAAEVRRGKRFFDRQISVLIPPGLPDEDIPSTVSNLKLALAKLQYQYLIFRHRESVAVSSEKHREAVGDLQQLGFEIDHSMEGTRIQRAVTHNWHPSSPKEVKALISNLQTLLNKSRETGLAIEVLAESSKP